MDQPLFMGILQTSRHLNGDGQYPLLHFFLCAFVERAVPDPVLQAAAVHPFREDGGNAADVAHIITADNAGVQAQTDPVLTFRDKLFFAAVAALGKEPRLRALHGKIHVPASMVHPPYASHAAMNRIRSHLVCIQDRVAVVYLLVGDRFRSFSFC